MKDNAPEIVKLLGCIARARDYLRMAFVHLKNRENNMAKYYLNLALRELED